MTEQETIDIFKQSGALLDGHFILRSGLRSRQFFQCALALQEMKDVKRLGAALADQVKDLEIRTVVAPAMGGLVLGQEVARQLNCRFIFVEKVNDVLELRRNFQIAENEKVLIVEDVITRGGRVQETMDIVRNHKADLVGLAVAVDRSNGNFDPGVPIFRLLNMVVETFDPENLPDDLKDIPAIKPGS